jgi:hypothetical protein
MKQKRILNNFLITILSQSKKIFDKKIKTKKKL